MSLTPFLYLSQLLDSHAGSTEKILQQVFSTSRSASAWELRKVRLIEMVNEALLSFRPDNECWALAFAGRRKLRGQLDSNVRMHCIVDDVMN